MLPALLPAGVAEALRRARGLRVLVANLAPERGETVGYTLRDHVEAVEAHAGGAGRRRAAARHDLRRLGYALLAPCAAHLAALRRGSAGGDKLPIW